MRFSQMETTIKVVKVVNKEKVYTDQKGKEHTATNYYTVITINGNQTWVAIRPSFSKGYSALDMVAEVVINGKGE